MPFDFSDWLDDDSWHITGIASTKHPEGGSYAIPCPSIRDAGILRRIDKRHLDIAVAEAEAKEAADSDSSTAETVAQVSERLSALYEENARDYAAFLDVEDLMKISDPRVEMQKRLLGPVYQQMVDDEVSSDRLDRIYEMTLVRFTTGEETVRRIVEFEGKAAALQAEMEQANRATRRAVKKAATKAAPRTSSPKATSRSSRASSATKARTPAKASTRSSKTSAAAAKQTA